VKRSTRKSEGLLVRLDRSQKQRIARAARLRHLTASEFMRVSAMEAADRVLSDQTRFVLDDAQWKAFRARLERPARDLPGLRAVLLGSNPLDAHRR